MTNLDYLYNPEIVKPLFNKNYFVDKKLGFRVIENGTMLPYISSIAGLPNRGGWGFGGIFDGEGKFIRGTHVDYGVINVPPYPPRINPT